MRSRLFVLIIVSSLGALAAQVTNSVSATGFITDTLCGAKGANALHIDHAKRSVASGKAKYALYDEATKKLYILDGSASLTTGPQGSIEQYLGQRVKITGTLSTSPLTRAGQSYAPDAVAAPKDSAGNADQSNAARTVSGNPSAPAGQGPARVQGHRKALDISTPIPGVPTISSVECAGTHTPRNQQPLA